ncbi:hypothetical protein ACIPJS_04535 [Streptomyces sp. NPDC086783]|uniref:hypothetical protein n=1 Tax=Streptomyces sp. NPDC086783 TaxID=3365758 RepID=UPI0038076BD9
MEQGEALDVGGQPGAAVARGALPDDVVIGARDAELPDLVDQYGWAGELGAQPPDADVLLSGVEKSVRRSTTIPSPCGASPGSPHGVQEACGQTNGRPRVRIWR